MPLPRLCVPRFALLPLTIQTALSLLLLLCLLPALRAQGADPQQPRHYVCSPAGVGPLALILNDAGNGKTAVLFWRFERLFATYTQQGETIHIRRDTGGADASAGETLFVLRHNESNGLSWEKGGCLEGEAYEWFSRYNWVEVDVRDSQSPASGIKALHEAQFASSPSDAARTVKTLPAPFMDVSLRIFRNHYQFPKLLGSPNISAETLRALYEDLKTNPGKSGNESHALHALARHPATPPDVLQELMKMDDAPGIWQAVALNPSTNGAFMAAYLERIPTAKPWVRTLIAKDPQAPKQALEVAIAQNEKDALQALSHNPNAPVEMLVNLLDNPHTAKNLSGLAGNPKTPPAILQKLAEGDDHGIHLSLLQNEALPTETAATVLRKIATARSANTLRRIVYDKRLPADIMETLSTHPLTDIRRDLASNEALPQEILQRLCLDSRRSVALAARRQMKARFLTAYSQLHTGWTPPDQLNPNDHLDQDFEEAVRAGNRELALQLLQATTDKEAAVSQQVRIRSALHDNFALFADIVAEAVEADRERGAHALFYSEHLQPEQLSWAIEKGFLEHGWPRTLALHATEHGRADLLQTLETSGQLNRLKPRERTRALSRAIAQFARATNPGAADAIITFWLRQGADPYEDDEEDGWAPIDLALQLLSPDLISRLDSRGEYKALVAELVKNFPSTAHSPFVGIWSNRANEFAKALFVLRTDGSGIIGNSVAVLPLQWKHISPEKISITVTQQGRRHRSGPEEKTQQMMTLTMNADGTIEQQPPDGKTPESAKSRRIYHRKTEK